EPCTCLRMIAAPASISLRVWLGSGRFLRGQLMYRARRPLRPGPWRTASGVVEPAGELLSVVGTDEAVQGLLVVEVDALSHRAGHELCGRASRRGAHVLQI